MEKNEWRIVEYMPEDLANINEEPRLHTEGTLLSSGVVRLDVQTAAARKLPRLVPELDAYLDEWISLKTQFKIARNGNVWCPTENPSSRVRQTQLAQRFLVGFISDDRRLAGRGRYHDHSYIGRIA
jgi:hypothetical protein